MAKQDSAVKSVTAVQAQAFVGPIPPPSVLSEYEDRFPGFGERILALAEREAKHRHDMDETNARIAQEEMRAARIETRRGQVLASLISVCAFATAYLCARCGQPWVGGIIAGTTLASVVWAIVKGRKA